MSRVRWLVGLLAVGFVTTCGCSAANGDRLAESVTVAFDSPLNLIVVEAKIRDQGPFRFFLDSGATGTVIDADVAKRLGLETGASKTRPGTAAGSQVTVAAVAGGVDFLLAPGFEFHVDHVITAPLGPTGKVMLGEQVDGILGSALFFSYVIEVDYAKRKLIFHDPSRYRYDGPGSVLDLDFPSRMPSLPFIEATLVNGSHRLSDMPILVDSGGQTMGTASVARRQDWDAMLTPDNRIIDALGATGLSNDAEGTTHEAFVTRMDKLTLGPFEFDDPLVSYSGGGPGIAVMGASLLHRFTVVFDYSRKRMILEPNERFDEAPMIDRSGVFLVSSDTSDDFEVMFVAEGTPGHEAGLARDDVIRAVDGVPTRDIRLNDARRMFSRTDSYRLDVERGERSFEAVIKTRPLFGD